MLVPRFTTTVPKYNLQHRLYNKHAQRPRPLQITHPHIDGMCLPHTNVFPVPTMVYAVPCPVNTTHKCIDQAVCSLPRLSHHRHSCCMVRRCYYLIVCRARLWVLAHCATHRPNTRAHGRARTADLSLTRRLLLTN